MIVKKVKNIDNHKILFRMYFKWNKNRKKNYTVILKNYKMINFMNKIQIQIRNYYKISKIKKN